jgi:hypothetical protein
MKGKLLTGLLLLLGLLLYLNSSSFLSMGAAITTNLNLFESDAPIDPECTKVQEDDLDIVKIEFSDYKKWEKNYNTLPESSQQVIPYIPDEFKQKFLGNLTISDDNGKPCKYEVEIALTGDGRDHLGGPKSSSLSIKLINANLAGVTRFKFLVPETRLSSNEIFAAQFMRNMGFISPITKYVTVEIEGETSTYIFQEQFAKELIERSKRPEGYILEGNEKTLSSEIAVNSEVMFKPLGRVMKSQWIEAESNRVPFGLHLLTFLNTVYLNQYSKEDPRLLRVEIDVDKEFFADTKLFNIFSMAIRAEHGLAIHNRRFYVNPFDLKFTPSYYDGMSRILEAISKDEYQDQAMKYGFDPKYYSKEIWLEARARLDKIHKKSFLEKLSLSGVMFSEKKLDQILLRIEKHLEYLQTVKTITEKVSRRDYFGGASRVPGYLGFTNGDGLTICKPNLEKCFIEPKRLTKSRLQDFIYGRYLFNGELVRPISISKSQYISDSYIFKDYLTDQKESIVKYKNFPELTTYGLIDLKFDLKQKKLTAIAHSNDARIAINSALLIDWDITFLNLRRSNVEPNQESILNQNACVTVYDSKLIRSNIKITNCRLGDGLNLVMSNVVDSRLAIVNSVLDALDSDFNSIVSSDIQIKGAGGDCTDFSFTNMDSSSISSTECSDKGLSVGESSIIYLKNVSIDKSKIGIAVKDSAVLKIESVEVNAMACFLAYRKKQEFSGGYLEIQKVQKEKCSKQYVYEQIGSEVNFHDISN